MDATPVQGDALVSHWFPVCRADELRERNPIRAGVLHEDLVIWATQERIMAWRNECAHRGARLSGGRVVNEQLECPYHGWRYGVDGACQFIPSQPDGPRIPRARAKAIYPVAQSSGLVWVALGDTGRRAPEIPRFTNLTCHVFASKGTEIRCSALRIVENFLDTAHFPFVHKGLLGTPEHPVIDDFEVQTLAGDEVFAENVCVYQPDPDGTGEGRRVSYDYWILAPTTACLVKHVNGRHGDEKLMIMLAVRPVTEDRSYAYFAIATNYNHDQASDADVLRFHERILLQDIPIVEGQPRLMSLDHGDDLHLKSDKLTSAYRKYLKKLGVRFGIKPGH